MKRYERGELPNPDWNGSGWVGAGPNDDLERRLAAAEEPFDEAQPHVMTALGPIAPEALGVTLVAGRDRPLVGPGRDPGAALLELEQLSALGVGGIVDLASAATAQRLADARWISARALVHIIVGADRAGSWTAAKAEGVRVGLEIAGNASDDLSEHAQFDLPVFVRIDSPSQLGRVLARVRASAWERAPWIVADESMVGSGWDRDAALASGVGLALIGSTADVGGMERAASLCRDLVDRGFGGRLALGYNADPINLMERLPVLLMEAGLPAIAVRRLLVENPARALTRMPGPA